MGNNINSKIYRNEWKYNYSVKEWGRLQEKLKKVLVPDSHASKNGRYRVHSLYFDDLCNSCMTDTEAGASSRFKFRIRYYGDSTDTIRLECKKKFNGRCRKLVTRLTLEQYSLLIQGEADRLFAETDDELLKRFCLCFSERLLTPRVIIDYDRTAYIDDITNIRITYDENISASNETDRFLTRDYINYPIDSENHVLEVKFDNILPGYLVRLINEQYPEVTTYSKYHLGRVRCKLFSHL